MKRLNAVSEANFMEVSAQDDLINWFSGKFNGHAIETVKTLGNLKRHFVSFIDLGERPSSGHGNDPDRKVAALKAMAEWIERRHMRDVFKYDVVHVQKAFGPTNPRVLTKLPPFKNSNGWAVHFSKETAINSAFIEALERHILTATYLKHGWVGFALVSEMKVENFEIFSLVSSFSCMGYRAGMVILRGSEFNGISVGYLCEKEDQILTSPRWSHALGEAMGFWQRSTLVKDQLTTRSRDVLFNQGMELLNTPWHPPSFSKSLPVKILPKVDPVFFTADLRNQFELPCEFHSSFVFGGGMIPLLIESPPNQEQSLYLERILDTIDIKVSDIPTRMPIL